METEDIVEIEGNTYHVMRDTTLSGRAVARLHGNDIIITLPIFLRGRRAAEIFTDLKTRMMKRIRRNHGVPFRKAEIVFRNNQTVNIMGNTFSILAIEEASRKRSTARLYNNTIKIFMMSSMTEEQKNNHISNLARRVITKAVLPAVKEHVDSINAAHFNSQIGNVRLKDNMSNWGSCSRDNNINLDFRLLFAPTHILDAVIAHELAHTKHRNHSKAFYGALLGAMPDYKERRRWLKLNGNLLNSSSGSATSAPAIQTPL